MVGWAKTHGSCNFEFGECNGDNWVFMRTWADAVFKRTGRTVLGRHTTDPSQEVAIREQTFEAIRVDVSGVALCCGSRFALAGSVRFPASEHTQKVFENIWHDLQLLKCELMN